VTVTPTSTAIARLVALVLPVALVASCGGGGDGDADATTTTAATTTEAPATTQRPATTTTRPRPTTTTEAATTTTVPAGPVMPLTGLPVTDEVLAARPALVVKIDNHPTARPQSGLGVADLVYEENVEGLTRFAAVFQSTDSDPVGPIRSGRTQDVDLLGSLDRPLFAWSGGNANVTRAIRGSDLVELSPTSAGDAGGFFRSDRPGPHDLYATTTALFTLTPIFAPPPPQQFAYRPAGAPPAGAPSPGLAVAMEGVSVEWAWDAAGGRWLRSQDGRPHEDAETGPIGADNVVVLEVQYRPSPADARSPEAQTTGTGRAVVLTGGNVVEGTWTREDRLLPFTLTDAEGAPIELTPGRTWVELARAGAARPLG